MFERQGTVCNSATPFVSDEGLLKCLKGRAQFVIQQLRLSVTRGC